MPATRSRCDSGSNSSRSRCVGSLTSSAPTRRSIAVMLRSNSLRRRSGIRCRTCRNSLVKSLKVRFVFPSESSSPPWRSYTCTCTRTACVILIGIRLAACTVLTVMLFSPCSWQTHIQLVSVESKSQSSRIRPAAVRRIFPASPVIPSPRYPPYFRGPRATEGDRGGGT